MAVKNNGLSEQTIKIAKKSYYQEKDQTPNQNQYFPSAPFPVFPLVEKLGPSCTVAPLRGFTVTKFFVVPYFSVCSQVR